MNRYTNADEFLAINKEDFAQIQQGAKSFKSPEGLSQMGMPLAEAERLSYVFLNLVNKATDMMLGLAASASNAKSEYKKVESLVFKESDGRVKDKEFAATSHPEYLRWVKNHNDLQDIYDYLMMKRSDFEKAHFYYKHLMGSK